MRENYKLYRLIYGTRNIDPDALVYPKIPLNRMDGEDNAIPRICTSTSLDGCLTGVGPSHIGLHSLQENLIDHDGFDADSLLFPFTVLQFEMSRNDPALMRTGKVAKYVPDAWMSEECWITKPVFPTSVRHLWLTGGVVEETAIVLGEEHRKYKYLMVSDSKWSHEPCAPESDFKLAIVNAAKRSKAMLLKNKMTDFTYEAIQYRACTPEEIARCDSFTNFVRG